MRADSWEFSALPRRAVPQPWEALTSVISRTARKMGYDDPGWILQPELIAHRIDPQALLLLRRYEDYRMLERLLALEKETILALTLHRFAARFEAQVALDPPQEGRDESVEVQYPFLDYLLPFSPIRQYMRVCPLCLDEPGGYDRLYWWAEALLSCPRHGVLLVDRCPNCRAPIPAFRPDLALCPSCKQGDYRCAIIQLPDGEEWLSTSQDILLHQLGIDEEELDGRSPRREPSLLHELSPRDYFFLAAHLRGLFDPHPTGGYLRPLLLRTLSLEGVLPRPVRPTLALLHYLLADWPAHFWGMLEHCQRALWEDSFRFPHTRAFAEQWNTEFARRDYWNEEAYREESAELLGSFSSEMSRYFRHYRDRVWHDEHEFGETVLPEGHPYLRQLAHPTRVDAVTPLPWEDLASVICRTARAMHYGHPSWVVISAEPPRRKVYTPDLPLLHHLDDYGVLERQLGIAEEDLYALSLHRFVGLLQPRVNTPEEAAAAGDIPRPLLGRRLAEKRFLPLDQIKVCPACLDEPTGYDRLFWRLQSVVVCPRHELLLVDRCPACHACIPPLRPHLTLCPSCQQGDYRRATHMRIVPTSWLWRGQELLFEFIDAGGGQGCLPSPFFVESPLARVQPWEYFELLTCFHFLLLGLRPGSVLLYAFRKLACGAEGLAVDSPALQAMSTHLAFFHFTFALWPEHFLALIDAYTSIMKAKQIGKELFESQWDPHQVFEQLWPSWQQAGDAYSRLVRVTNMLYYRGLAWEVPGEAPFPPAYHRARIQLVEDYHERFGLEPDPFPRARW